MDLPIFFTPLLKVLPAVNEAGGHCYEPSDQPEYDEQIRLSIGHLECDARYERKR